MQHKTTFFVGLLILLLLLAYFVTFQVRFNEVVVLTTFDRAGENAVIRGDDTTGLLGNLHLKWPPPIQVAHAYDQRVRILEDAPEELQTLDRKSIVVSTYVAWRIDDPLSFHRNVRHEAAAEDHLRARLRDARSILGQYNFDQLTNLDPDQLKLAQAEAAIREKLQTALTAQGFGLKIESVGIKRLILPQSVAQKVFEQMNQQRQTLAANARYEGNAAAATIKADAQSVADRILSFAEARAQAIRAQGAAEAARHYAVFSQNEDFAIFLRKLEAYREIFSHNTTFVIDAKEGGLGAEFYHGPQLTQPPLKAADPATPAPAPATATPASTSR
jgi:membrane protease subunit HflC